MDVQTMDSLVKELRCSICHDYLLMPSIVLLEDGTSACGNCVGFVTPRNCEGLVVRQWTLEQVLAKLSFPCFYKPAGCQERILFGLLNHQEDECFYRPLPCPTKKCPWTGSMFVMQKHFVEAHADMVKKAVEFNLQLDKDYEETVLAVLSKVPVVVKCIYTAEQCQLFLHINCLTLDEAFYKIWVRCERFADNRIVLTKEKCLPYASSACKGALLNLRKFMPVLKGTDSVMVEVEMMIEKKQGNDAVVPANPAGAPPNPAGVPSNSAGGPAIPNMGNIRYANAARLPLLPLEKTLYRKC